MKIRVHFNKRGADHGRPWTVHTSKCCLPATHVRFRCTVETEEKPGKKDNPRYFVTCRGLPHLEPDGSITILPELGRGL